MEGNVLSLEDFGGGMGATAPIGTKATPAWERRIEESRREDRSLARQHHAVMWRGSARRIRHGGGAFADFLPAEEMARVSAIPVRSNPTRATPEWRRKIQRVQSGIEQSLPPEITEEDEFEGAAGVLPTRVSPEWEQFVRESGEELGGVFGLHDLAQDEVPTPTTKAVASAIPWGTLALVVAGLIVGPTIVRAVSRR